MREQYLTSAGLAETTGLPESWIKAEARAGRIPSIQAGRRLMFDPALVRVALTERSAGKDIVIIPMSEDGRIINGVSVRKALNRIVTGGGDD